jgi:hypothetical protein
LRGVADDTAKLDASCRSDRRLTTLSGILHRVNGATVISPDGFGSNTRELDPSLDPFRPSEPGILTTASRERAQARRQPGSPHGGASDAARWGKANGGRNPIRGAGLREWAVLGSNQ